MPENWEHRGHVVEEPDRGPTDEEFEAALADALRRWAGALALLAKYDEENHEPG